MCLSLRWRWRLRLRLRLQTDSRPGYELNIKGIGK